MRAPEPSLREIEREVPGCRRCPRLTGFLAELRVRHADYWNRPVPGFGDPEMEIWKVEDGLIRQFLN